MSSDVQGEGTRQEPSARGLEDLKEATDETEADVSPDARLVALDAGDPDVLFLPLNLTVGINPRHSYPPTKDLLPYQHVMRSFSDSHLCLKLTTTANFTPYKLPSPMGSSSLLLVEEEGWDAEYVQQWLRYVPLNTELKSKSLDIILRYFTIIYIIIYCAISIYNLRSHEIAIERIEDPHSR